MMNLKFLTSLNVAYDDDELLDVIEHLAAEIEAGTLAPKDSGRRNRVALSDASRSSDAADSARRGCITLSLFCL